MSRLPIIARFAPKATPHELAKVEALAEELLATKELGLDPTLRTVAGVEWHDAPELHIDDQSDITSKELPYDTSYGQDRARLRAAAGDIVVCNRSPTPGYESYCRDYLGLGAVEWLAPEAQRFRRHLASHAWTNRSVRRELSRAIRKDGLRTIHPLMGSREAWHLALLLHEATRRPISILAPPPALARWVNDKTEFARTVTELFGESSLPLSRDATSLALISRDVKDIAAGYQHVGVKLPDPAGGAGIVVVPSRRFRDRNLDATARDITRLLRTIGWRSGMRVLISGWESDVLQSPSVQTWIPAGRDEPPIIEGIFEQILAGGGYEFVGTRPAMLPHDVAELIVTRSWLLALLYQRLGYVGRCSFDLVLIGTSLEDCRPEFIECNGRWGGTSLPMTLVHRLVGGDPASYVVRAVTMRGLARVDFPTLLSHFEDELFDVRARRGRLVFFNPARLTARSAVSFIAFGENHEDAQRFAAERVPSRLKQLARWRHHRTKIGLP